MLRAPRATFPKATRVPGLINVERHSTVSRILKKLENRLLRSGEKLRQAGAGKLEHALSGGCGILSIVALWSEPQHKGVGALYFGAERV